MYSAPRCNMAALLTSLDLLPPPPPPPPPPDPAPELPPDRDPPMPPPPGSKAWSVSKPFFMLLLRFCSALIWHTLRCSCGINHEKKTLHNYQKSINKTSFQLYFILDALSIVAAALVANSRRTRLAGAGSGNFIRAKFYQVGHRSQVAVFPLHRDSRRWSAFDLTGLSRLNHRFERAGWQDVYRSAAGSRHCCHANSTTTSTNI